MELLKHLFAAKADSFTNAKFSYALTESIELILSLFERELMTNQNREIIPLISSVVLDLQVTAYIPHQIDILLRLPKSELCRKVSKLCCFRLLQSLTQTSSHVSRLKCI